MYVSLQDQIDAAVAARVSICLGIAPLLNPSANFRGGSVTLMQDGTIVYSPPNDKWNQDNSNE